MGGASVDWFDLADGGEAHLLTISYEANEEVTRTTSEGLAGRQEWFDVSFANG